ncbi:hypothetical protein WMY93_024684 [Mugilogobius chulae]|uniref:Mitotic interactor and substrate of PLK1 n=1 Tax=Mugilogobius chulae TaxID=88201 RepID=A0AAW0NCC2_9GOBI
MIGRGSGFRPFCIKQNVTECRREGLRLSAAGPQDALSRLHLFTPVYSLAPEPRPPDPWPRPLDPPDPPDPTPCPARVMDSTPRRWELRPLSPSLQPSDLRSISVPQDQDLSHSSSISVVGSRLVYVDGHSDLSADVTVAARQVSVSQDDSSSSDELPISPCSSSSVGSHSGFYSFVEDPLSPEAEQNQAWMVSPQRQTHLSLLREENSFRVQTYSSPSKPASLFQDDTDSQYEIRPKYGYKVKNAVEEKELDDTNRLIQGFSLSFNRVSDKPKPLIDSDAIDEEQINFDAARKQFLQMEQNKIDPIIRPRKIQVKISPKPKQVAFVLAKRKEILSSPSIESEKEFSSFSRQSSNVEEADGHSQNISFDVLTKQDAFVLAKREEIVSSPSIEDEKEDEFSSFSRQSRHLQDADGHSQSFSFEVLTIEQPEPETPIEREIRIAQEREENLRRSRGLQSSISGGEMVQIQTKRLNSTSTPTPLTPSRIKDRGRGSFIFQEIQRKEEAIKDAAAQESIETRRERANSFDVLRSNESSQEYVVSKAFEKLKGSTEDRLSLDVVDYALQKQNYQQNNAKQVQEHQEQARNGGFANGNKLENGFKSVVERSRVDSSSDDVFLPCCPHKHPDDSDRKQDSPRAGSPQIPAWRDTLERTGLQQARGQGAALFVERDIEEALRREQELKEQREAREKVVYSPQTLVEQADKMAAAQFYPQSKTVQVESRTSSSHPVRLSSVPLMSPQPWSPAPQTPLNPQTRPFIPETRPLIQETRPLNQETRPLDRMIHPPQTPLSPASSVLWPAPQTPLSPAPQTPLSPSSFSAVRTQFPVRGLTQTLLQDFEERRVKLKLEESKYAGIQPIDSVNNEVSFSSVKLKPECVCGDGAAVLFQVVESTRVTRHKNQRALQWEAGLYANRQDE